VVQGEGPKFKPQYCRKREKKNGCHTPVSVSSHL
jgi:hypothetical protein